MSKVAEIFESLEYGPAPESATPVLSWLDALFDTEHVERFRPVKSE